MNLPQEIAKTASELYENSVCRRDSAEGKVLRIDKFELDFKYGGMLVP